MIVLKTSRELSLMRKAGKISQKALRLAGEAVEPGVSTWEIERSSASISRARGQPPASLVTVGFPPAPVSL